MLFTSKRVNQARDKSGQLNTQYNKHAAINQRHCSGFSFIEISITLSILSISLMTTLPHSSEIIASTRLKTTSYSLQRSLNLARQNALTTTLNTYICPLKTSHDSECSNDTDFNADWSHGWIVYSDLNDNNQLDDSDKIIQKNTLNKKVNIVFNQRGRLRFFHDGSARSAGFYLCSSSTSKTRHMKLLHTGRSRVTEIDTEKQQSICLST